MTIFRNRVLVDVSKPRSAVRPLLGELGSLGSRVIPFASKLEFTFKRSNHVPWLFPDWLIQTMPQPGKKKKKHYWLRNIHFCCKWLVGASCWLSHLCCHLYLEMAHEFAYVGLVCPLKWNDCTANSSKTISWFNSFHFMELWLSIRHWIRCFTSIFCSFHNNIVGSILQMRKQAKDN